MTSEVERIAELENLRYIESTILCPDCGCPLMTRYTTFMMLDVEIFKLEDECPSCHYTNVLYDSD